MAETVVSYEKRGPMGLITLRRPAALNALTHAMIGGIQQHLKEAEADPDVVAICITGEGRGFTAGLDMEVLAGEAGGTGASSTRDGPALPLFGFILDITKPVIAAVNGPAAGGGFVLAMMCDLRFMAEEAIITTVFTKRGLIAEHGTSWLLPRIVGLSRALDLLWSSRRIDAAEAYRIGIADRVVKGAELIATVEAYIQDMADTVAPRSLATIKRQVLDHLHTPFKEAMVQTDGYIRASLAHPDATEGVKSFVERRKPAFEKWKGGKP